MIDIKDYYETILWPAPYVRQALKRSAQLPESLSALKNLYQYTFAEHRIFSTDTPFELPLSQKLEPQKPAELVAHDDNIPLSIVTITRNDDHVERMQERTQAFIDSLYWLSEHYAKPVELIIVEWNPPSDRKPLGAQFKFRKKHPYLSIIIITVPSEIHQNYQLADDLPLYQMIGKNVGIRRARGKFVLATNIDVLLSKELFEFITDDDLMPGRHYRSNRWDVDRTILDLDSPEVMLTEARNLCFQVNYPEGVKLKQDLNHTANSHDNHASGLAMSKLHTWACGDFQLLHRDDWAKLTGYSELDAYSFHLDSLFAITCHYAGIEEVALPDQFPHFHIDHTLGTPVKSNTYIINEKKALYHLCYMSLLRSDYQMQLRNDCYIFNEPHWGLSGFTLPYQQVSRADWEVTELTYQSIGENKSPASRQSPQYFQSNEKQYEEEVYTRFLSEAYFKTEIYLKTEHSAKKLFIWGAGKRGQIHMNQLSRRGISISGFIHGTNTPIADELDGIPVHSASDFLLSADVFILIASIFAEEIIQHLQSLGAKEGEQFLVLM